MTIKTGSIGLRVRYLMPIDLACILLAVLMSFMVRYEALAYMSPYLLKYWTLFILVPVIRLPVYYMFGLYRRLWRYASIVEFKKIILAGLIGSILIFVVNLLIFPLLKIPYSPSRSVLIIEFGFSTALLGATRLALRLLQERITPQQATRLKPFTRNPRKILIAGAGDAGVMILRETIANPGLGLKVIGFVDDDHTKLKKYVHNVRVLGTCEDIPALVQKYHVDEVIIAMPSAAGKDIRHITAICDRAKVLYRITPGIFEMIDGAISVRQIRNVQIEDLLRRPPVKSNATSEINLRDTVVIITGAAGSIGSELSRQVAQQQPRKLILLDQAETPLYHIDMELRTRYSKLEIIPVLADVRDIERINRIFKNYEPEIIFHAAAYKHVPLMEANPEEVILNNIVGTQNLLQASEQNNVEKFVLISTDKAVNPSNFMGASKRIAELLLQDSARRSKRHFVAVRFGNVLGSQGSVIPRFKQQIAEGGPITVTHPEIQRYFMTIPEAVQLVIQAAFLGDGGEIFVLDMGEPVKIIDLARDLITLSGLRPNKDIDIVFTGLRPGEKLNELLFNEHETYSATAHEKINVVITPPQLNGQDFYNKVENLIQSAREGKRSDLWMLIQNVIPESKRMTDNNPIPTNGNTKIVNTGHIISR